MYNNLYKCIGVNLSNFNVNSEPIYLHQIENNFYVFVFHILILITFKSYQKISNTVNLRIHFCVELIQKYNREIVCSNKFS